MFTFWVDDLAVLLWGREWKEPGLAEEEDSGDDYGVVAAGVAVGVLVIWLSTARLSFTWRMSWIAAAVVAVCASSVAAAVHLMTFLGDGIFELVRGVAVLLGAI